MIINCKQISSPVRALKNLYFAHEFYLNSFMLTWIRLEKVEIFPMQISAKLPEKPYQLKMSAKSLCR